MSGPADSTTPANPSEELVEVVDPEGTVTGVVARREMRRRRLRHRASFVAVHDGHGRLLVHQRSPDKDVWPSRWDIAAGGVASVGESWHDAAARELAEELGITAPLDFLGEDSYDDADVSLLAGIFCARHDPLVDAAAHGTVRFADGEAVAMRWATLEELRELVTTEDFCPDSLAVVLPRIESRLAADATDR